MEFSCIQKKVMLHHQNTMCTISQDPIKSNSMLKYFLSHMSLSSIHQYQARGCIYFHYLNPKDLKTMFESFESCYTYFTKKKKKKVLIMNCCSVVQWYGNRYFGICNGISEFVSWRDKVRKC